MDISRIIKEPASVNIDFFWHDKRRMIPNLFPTICALLNTDGGQIFVGLDREKRFQGLSDSQIDEFIKNFNELTRNHKGYLNPSIGINTEVFEIDGSQIIRLKIPKVRRAYKSGDKYYVRKYHENIHISSDSELTELLSRKKGSTELDIIPYLTSSDFDFELLNKARSIAERRDSTHKWLSMTDQQILKASYLYHEDRASDIEGYTLACLVLLGKDKTIGRELPEYRIDIYDRRVNSERWDDRKTITTNLIDSRDVALDIVKGYLPSKFFLDGTQRIDLRDAIMRELISNILVHREYRSTKPTEVVIEKSKVTATNPSIVLNRGSINPNMFSPDPKNPKIRSFFRELGWSEEAGSGIRNIKRYLNYYIPGVLPEFIEEEIFTTNIPLRINVIGDFSEHLMKVFHISPDRFDSAFYESFKSIPLSSDLIEFSNELDFIIEYIGTLHENVGELKDIKILRSKAIKNLRNKTWGSLEELGGELLTKKGRQLLKTLIGLLEPKKIEEILDISGLDNREGFRANYLNSLRSNELVQLTIPHKPNDPNQKYVITEKGKNLLGGIVFKK